MSNISSFNLFLEQLRQYTRLHCCGERTEELRKQKLELLLSSQHLNPAEVLIGKQMKLEHGSHLFPHTLSLVWSNIAVTLLLPSYIYDPCSDNTNINFST